MERNIPIPAESLRTIAEGSAQTARQTDGAMRRRLEQCTSEAFSALEGKDGEFVSIDGSTVSTLAAHSDSPGRRHERVARVFLEQYGIWS